MITVETASYGPWRNCRRISDGRIELVFLGCMGPRIIRAGFVGGRNLFKETSPGEERIVVGDGALRLAGGHRIWAGPEDPAYSYAPDNEPVEFGGNARSVRATAPVDAAGLRKEIEAELLDSGEVRVYHRLTNESRWPLRFAPWTLTMMAPGGSGISTFPPRGTHPEHLEPSNPLVMWRFTDLSDPRWKLLEKYAVLHSDATRSRPQKIGLFNERTRGAYLLDGNLFVKKYEAPAGPAYPDMGASFEMFANDLFLELETLGPLREVKPGETAEHVETWAFHRGIEVREWTGAELDASLGPLLE